jgi:hypothetical protein
MRRPFIPWAAIALLNFLIFPPYDASAAGKPTATPVTLTGRVTFRTGPERSIGPDGKARVWLFKGRQELAVRSVEKLKRFDEEFPQGLTRVEDRPKEDQTRMAAMVLMSYAVVHKESLRTALPVGTDGSFHLEWDGKEPITIVAESAATLGSYHMPRYSVATLEPGRPLPSLHFDFGVSHLENHPAEPAKQ